MEQNTKTVEVKSRFGTCIVERSELLHFPEGMIGIENKHDFALLQMDSEAPFLLLQSIEDESTSFLVTNPLLFMDSYNFELSEENKLKLGASSKEDVIFLTILTIPEGFPEASHIFLLAPILINLEKRVAIQMVNEVYEGEQATWKLNLTMAEENTLEEVASEKAIN